MKKFPPGLSLLLLVAACTGQPASTPAAAQPAPKKEQIADYKVSFEKKIALTEDASGTLTIKKSGGLLFIHDGHVSSESLSCVDYASGKELWKIPHTVEHLYIYGDKLLVQFEDHVELLEMQSGKSAWKLDGAYIRYFYGELEPDDIVPVTYQDKGALLDLAQRKITLVSDSVERALLFKTDAQGNITRKFTGIDKKQKVPGKLREAIVVENAKGERLNYFWSLEDKKRQFTLTAYKGSLPVDTLVWVIPDVGYADKEPYYRHRGEPDPETLQTSAYFINGRLFLYENYVNYRWSWGQGSNRITCIDPEEKWMEYQVWGRAPGETDFSTFNFMNDAVLRSDHVLYSNSPAGRICPVELETGRTLDSLYGGYNSIMSFRPNLLVGLNFYNHLHKNNKYQRGAKVTVLNLASNRHSETFDFDFKEAYPYESFLFGEEGLLMMYNFNDSTKHNDLYCYRIAPLK